MNTTDMIQRFETAYQSLGEPDWAVCEQALRAAFSDTVDFADPIFHVQGMHAFLRLNRRLRATTRALRIEIERTVAEDDVLFSRWRVYAKPKVGPSMCVEGCSFARFNQAGQITQQRDYWDTLQSLRSMLPRLGTTGWLGRLKGAPRSPGS